jgi:hypothetical protein
VPPIGALAERVGETQAGWLMTDDEWRDDDRMLDRILALSSAAQRDARRAASSRATETMHPTPLAMSEATVALYRRALRSPAAARLHAPFSNARIRDAAGYRAWSPPAIESPVAAPTGGDAPRGVWHRVALRALAMRRTPMGRLLYRMTPEPLIDALKSRLHG